jgi:hypothetical protein
VRTGFVLCFGDFVSVEKVGFSFKKIMNLTFTEQKFCVSSVWMIYLRSCFLFVIFCHNFSVKLFSDNS